MGSKLILSILFSATGLLAAPTEITIPAGATVSIKAGDEVKATCQYGSPDAPKYIVVPALTETFVLSNECDRIKLRTFKIKHRYDYGKRVSEVTCGSQKYLALTPSASAFTLIDETGKDSHLEETVLVRAEDVFKP